MLWLTFGWRSWSLLLTALLLIDVFRQARRILPYTSLGRKEVLDFGTGQKPQARFSLLHWNVYQDNRQVEPLLEQVEKRQPDLIFLCETDQWWVDALEPLRQAYPNRLEVPLSNTYDLCLYAKHPLANQKVDYLVDDEVPSVAGELVLESGHKVQFYGLHPIPPMPEYSTSTIPRDAELLLVARQIEQNRTDQPQVVFGDLNEVTWSDTTQLFQKISRMADPRRGRGILPTFNARTPGFRIPIDQLFCSHHFQLIKLRRLPALGSDHYPLYIELALVNNSNPDEYLQMEKPDEEDYRQARKIIIEGKND